VLFVSPYRGFMFFQESNDCTLPRFSKRQKKAR